MAETIRIRKSLSREPEVSALVAASGFSRLEVIGLLIEFWAWADTEGRGTGRVNHTHLPVAFTVLENLCEEVGGSVRFWETMVAVGWLSFDLHAIIIPKSQKYRDKKVEPAKAVDLEQQGRYFVVFWQAYPNKRGKKAALKAWRKMELTDALMSKIMSALEVQKQNPAWIESLAHYGGRHVPHASTWLNGERWEDEGIERPVARSGREIVIPGKYAASAAQRGAKVVQANQDILPEQATGKG